jgi:DNA polymerase-3 subunit beta
MVINKDDLSGAVRRVSILSNALTHQVKFGLKNNSLTISTTNADVGGEGKESLNCEFSGEAVELGYNAAYVMDILGKIESDEIILELSNAVSAGVITSPELPKDEYLCLIMPLRLAE